MALPSASSTLVLHNIIPAWKANSTYEEYMERQQAGNGCSLSMLAVESLGQGDEDSTI